ncbi:membrane protein insertion efficiency factor YidD [Candidatus Williamhamiltonella defendens]|uniref:membrane protein insertion efficiency factor YidD n=1 Tax=Candidatus Williamhamiltonella defendens TaxID=138072 RepID=UPI00130DE4E5|nr:membrane protein insertion efficiency factor YidD [Candidatus Hamiltonella defensa]
MASLLSLSSKILIALMLYLIKAYQSISHFFLPPSCRFYPSCSDYAIESFRRFGVIKGSWVTAKRIIRCHPLHSAGNDPVPPKHYDHREY